jgi:hypothetical protein
MTLHSIRARRYLPTCDAIGSLNLLGCARLDHASIFSSRLVAFSSRAAPFPRSSLASRSSSRLCSHRCPNSSLQSLHAGVIIIAERRIQRKESRNSRQHSQKRPVSRTLTAVHEAILDDIVFPTEIVGKRTRVRLDGSKLLKVSTWGALVWLVVRVLMCVCVGGG